MYQLCIIDIKMDRDEYQRRGNMEAIMNPPRRAKSSNSRAPAANFSSTHRMLELLSVHLGLEKVENLTCSPKSLPIELSDDPY